MNSQYAKYFKILVRNSSSKCSTFQKVCKDLIKNKQTKENTLKIQLEPLNFGVVG